MLRAYICRIWSRIFIELFWKSATKENILILVSSYQLNAHFLYSITIYMLLYDPHHVSSSTLLIFRRTNCIITASGIVTAVQYAGWERTAVTPYPTKSHDVSEAKYFRPQVTKSDRNVPTIWVVPWISSQINFGAENSNSQDNINSDWFPGKKRRNPCGKGVLSVFSQNFWSVNTDDVSLAQPKQVVF